MMCSAWPRRSALANRVRRSLGALLLAALPTPAFAQETCQTATPIQVGQTFMGNNAAATTDPGLTLCAPSTRDVWHTFTPALTGVHTVSLCGSSFNTVAAVYLSCFDEPLDCNDDACGQQSVMAVAVTAGQPYILRVGAAQGSSGGTYRVTITPPAGATPGNNICGGGSILPPNQTVIGSNAGATGSDANAACGGANDRADVWYSFNPAASGLHILELCSTAFDGVLSVHSSCFNANILACSDDDEVLGCPAGAGSRVLFNAVAGTPVLIRIAGAEGSFGAYSLTIHTAAANDTCAAAQPVVRGNVATGAITPALSTDVAAPCAASANDLWYSYVATTTGPHTFSLCNSPTNTVLSVHSACPGSPGASVIACSDDGCTVGIGAASGASELIAPLQAGQLYLVRVAGRTSVGQTAAGSFSLLVDVTTPANDACTSPATLTLGLPVDGITYGATGTDISTCGESDALDVWYTFTPAQPGSYEFNTCGSALNTTLSLFSSCQTPIACSDDDPIYCGAGFSTGARLSAILNAGSTYLVRIAGINSAQGAFRLVVNRTPPPGDSCASAQAIPLGVTVSATLSAALPSGVPFCSGLDTPDVYFTFTPPQSRHYRFSTCGSTARTVLGLSTECPPGGGAAGTSICADEPDQSCNSGLSTDLTAVLQAGVTYRLRVAAASGESGGNIRLRIDSMAPPNDDCLKSQLLTVGTTVPASTVGATGQDLSPCGIADTRDIFFQFSPEQTGTYEFLTCAGFSGLVDTTLTLLDACDGTVMACNDDAASGSPCDGLLPVLSRLIVRLELGQTYLLRAAIVGDGEATFSVGVRYARPANDACAAALTVTDGFTLFDTLGATTESLTMAGCGLGFTQIANDVWFRYIATSTGPILVSTCGSGFDSAVAVLDGEQGCGPGLPVLACDDDFDCDQQPVTPDRQSRTSFNAVLGHAYLIRIGSLTGDRGPGDLRITRPGAPVCRCDWNGTGGLTVQDVFDFLQDWFAGAGDFNQSGSSELADLFAFLACYLTNPPECQ